MKSQLTCDRCGQKGKISEGSKKGEDRDVRFCILQLEEILEIYPPEHENHGDFPSGIRARPIGGRQANLCHLCRDIILKSVTAHASKRALDKEVSKETNINGGQLSSEKNSIENKIPEHRRGNNTVKRQKGKKAGGKRRNRKARQSSGITQDGHIQDNQDTRTRRKKRRKKLS